MLGVTFEQSLADLTSREAGTPELNRGRFATPGELARYCEAGTVQTPALDLIDRAAVDVVLGDTRRQQIYAPPQTGKSQRISRWTPLWALLHDPTLRIAIISADSELARRWGRTIRRDLIAHPELGLTLRADSQAAGRWETTDGGELFCAGYATGTTGRPVDLLVIDDPFPDRASAESKTFRERVWEFWENDASTRARRAILMHTRWHVDDLAGRLQEREPGEWSVLAMPAIAENDDDPLGREVGQEIQSANRKLHPSGYYYEQQKRVSPYVWSSLYQQHPNAAMGGIFKRSDWRYWRPAEDGKILVNDHPFSIDHLTKFITMDLATSTKTSADYTVASAWAITPFGQLVLLDRVRERVPATDHLALLEPLRTRWLTRAHTVWIESRMFGSTLVWQLGRKGVPVAELEADVDKFTRALPAADVVRQNRVFLPANAAWLDEWIDECADFQPAAARDDQVDTLAYAVRVLETRWLPPEDDHTLNARRTEALEAVAEIDFETVAW